MKAWAVIDKETNKITIGTKVNGFIVGDTLSIFPKRKEAREERIKDLEKICRVKITIIEEEKENGKGV